jgi:hypothetical protein
MEMPGEKIATCGKEDVEYIGLKARDWLITWCELFFLLLLSKLATSYLFPCVGLIFSIWTS